MSVRIGDGAFRDCHRSFDKCVASNSHLTLHKKCFNDVWEKGLRKLMQKLIKGQALNFNVGANQ
jgi:hypothetical protein